MINRILLNNMEQYYERILNDRTLIKEINFKNDIDEEKTKNNKYHIDSDKGFLEFSYQAVYSITEDDMLVIAENVKETEKSGLLPKRYSINYPNRNNYPELDKTFSHYLIKKTISIDLVDFICIDYKKGNPYFYVLLCDSNHTKLLKNIHSNKTLLDKENISLENANGCILNLWWHGCRINTYVHNRQNLDENNTISQERKIRERIIDLKNGDITTWYGNCKKKKENDKRLIQRKDFNMLVSFKSHQVEWAKSMKFINDIVLGTREGYVYLKPVEVASKSVEIAILYSGNVTVQCFNNKIGKWNDVYNLRNIKVNENIHIRFKMNCGSRIFGVLIMESEQ